jgi:hypothetical protein
MRGCEGEDCITNTRKLLVGLVSDVEREPTYHEKMKGLPEVN